MANGSAIISRSLASTHAWSTHPPFKNVKNVSVQRVQGCSLRHLTLWHQRRAPLRSQFRPTLSERTTLSSRAPLPGRAGGSFQARASSGGSAESSLRTTVELDKLIDSLRSADPSELPQMVAESIFSFDQNFWLRVATRAEGASSADDRRELEELSQTIMNLVVKVVRCTQDRMDSTSDKLADLLLAAAIVDNNQTAEEFMWPPQDPNAIQRLREELGRRDNEGILDDSFLASVSAQLRQATEKGDVPGLVAMLQKVLQLFAAGRFGARSYAVKGNGEEDIAEKLLETLLQAEVEDWDALLRQGLKLGGGSVSEDEFFQALELRSKRMLMRSESGSYEQRVLGEYLLELETRAQTAIKAFQTA